MKIWFLSVLLFAICVVAAAQTTEQQWQQEAARTHPTLGVRGSPLNKAFVAEYQRRKALPSEAAFFANPRWPMLLAEECERQVVLEYALKEYARKANPGTPGSPGSPAPPAASMAPLAYPLSRILSAFPTRSIAPLTMVSIVAISLMVGLVIGAFFVQLATRIVAGFVPPFGTACLAVFLNIVGALGVPFTAGILLGLRGGRVDASTSTFITVMVLVVQAFIYGSVLKDPAAGPIGFGKGCLVSIVQMIVVFGLAILAAIALHVFSHAPVKGKETQSLSHAIDGEATAAESFPAP